MAMVGRLSSQAPSKPHHSSSDGQPAAVEPSPLYILKTSPRPELESDGLEVDVGAAAEEDGACVVGLATLEVVSGGYVAGTSETTAELEVGAA